MRDRRLALWICGLIVSLASALVASPIRADEWTDQQFELERQFATRLSSLEQRCTELGLEQEAEITREWIIARSPERIYLFLPPASSPELVGEDGSPTRYWCQHFLTARREYAQQLFQLAKRGARERPDWAYQLAHQVLREDPEHEAARQALGYRRVDNRWVYGGDAIKSSVGAGALPEYGFAARQYYRIDSANFRILTNIDEQAGREMAQRLEELHCAWRQLFFEYWGSGPLLARRFQQGAPDARTRVDKHRIVWFQNREQYVAALRDDQPLIDKTLGIYLDGHRTVFLFGTAEQALTTWLHEVTHQLFNEHGRANDEVGSRGHIWVVEGIALFMESLWWHGDYCTVGGVDADRLQFARYRALGDRFHVPLSELVMIDRATIQNDARIGALYSQSAGLSHFFMTGEGGHLRPAFVQYIGAVYRNTASERQLATLVKSGYEELDQRYHAYLTVNDSRLAGCYPVTNLYLGHCAISDDGLRHVPLENVRWIDLGYTSITDQSVEHLKGASQLEKLTLEHTGVTAAALATLGTLTRLEYLDLSGLAITDQSLAELRSLENLKSLWLTGCPITDEGLKHLTTLRGLVTLDVSNTPVTAAGLARLKSALPNLAD